jgi:hypothetical protein
MNQPPTPGERCYDAFWLVQVTDGHLHWPPLFAQLPAITRQSWEAAAQAVLALTQQEKAP